MEMTLSVLCCAKKNHKETLSIVVIASSLQQGGTRFLSVTAKANICRYDKRFIEMQPTIITDRQQTRSYRSSYTVIR